MDDSVADQIIEYPQTGEKYVFIYPNNQYYDTLKNNYPDYYEPGCGCMIFPYDVWKGINV